MNENPQTAKVPNSLKEIVAIVKKQFPDNPQLIHMFEKCYTNTLNTTVKLMEDGTTYVITGDIPAMWLRDSSAQLRPYLIPAAHDKEIEELILGLVMRQFYYINIDAYANAFNETANGACWEKDETDMNDFIWERKYEIDSLCYPIQLAYLLWKNTGCTKQFSDDFIAGVNKIIDLLQTEQSHEETSGYRFIRRNTYFHDTLSRDGRGALVKSEVGLTWSGFRPSDDACTYGYLIPSNMFAAVVLGYVGNIADIVLGDETLKRKALKLREEIYEAIEAHGITKKEGFGDIYAYEVDGYGQYNLMDDANVPNLLSMDYMGYEGKDKAVAQNTRRFILSEGNPFYYAGKSACGIGSSHTPPNHIWPIALVMEGLTSDTREEKEKILQLLLQTDGDTGFMHESFHVNNPEIYTRKWFSWANALFCEFVLDLCGLMIKK